MTAKKTAARPAAKTVTRARNAAPVPRARPSRAKPKHQLDVLPRAIDFVNVQIALNALGLNPDVAEALREVSIRPGVVEVRLFVRDLAGGYVKDGQEPASHRLVIPITAPPANAVEG